MRAKTVIANREPQPLLRRAASSAYRPSHNASTATAEKPTTNAPRRERRKKDIRTLTVSMLLRQRSSRRSGHDRVPFLRVSGRWLEQCGFAIGARYYVTVAQGKLMLTLVEPDESDEPMGE
jgi:toxic protein SymE